MYITYVFKVYSKLLFEVVKSYFKSLYRRVVSGYFIHTKGPLVSIIQSFFFLIQLHAEIEFNFICACWWLVIACWRSVQNLWSCNVLSKNPSMKIYSIVILCLVLHGFQIGLLYWKKNVDWVCLQLSIHHPSTFSIIQLVIFYVSSCMSHSILYWLLYNKLQSCS